MRRSFVGVVLPMPAECASIQKKFAGKKQVKEWDPYLNAPLKRWQSMLGLFGWTKNNDGSLEKTIWLWKWPFCQAKHYKHALRSSFRHRPLLILLLANWFPWPAGSVFIRAYCLSCPITDQLSGKVHSLSLCCCNLMFHCGSFLDQLSGECLKYSEGLLTVHSVFIDDYLLSWV